MKLSKHVLYSAGAFVAIAAIGALTSPKLAAAVKAAYVEMVIPSHPYHQQVVLDVGAVFKIFGPDTGRLGVTNITLTNTGSDPEVVGIASVGDTSDGCGDSGALSNAVELAEVYVQGKSTLVIPYPAPLVVDNVNGHTCLAVEAIPSKGAWVDVSGFIN